MKFRCWKRVRGIQLLRGSERPTRVLYQNKKDESLFVEINRFSDGGASAQSYSGNFHFPSFPPKSLGIFKNSKSAEKKAEAYMKKRDKC